MSENSSTIKGFASMLKSYRNTLEKMNRLTDAEIDRVNSFSITMKEGEGLSGKEAAIFINKQMYSFLNKLEILINSVPDFQDNCCFSSEEVHILQEKALIKLKELGVEDLAEY